MSYLSKSLTKDERVVHVGSIHWMIHARPLLFLVLGAGIIFVAAAIRTREGDAAAWLGLVLGVIGSVRFIDSMIVRWTTELGVTNKKIVAKWGLISRRTIEQRLDKVDSVGVYQSVVGRLFDYGTIIIHGSGASLTPIKLVRYPLKFRREVENAIEKSAIGHRSGAS